MKKTIKYGVLILLFIEVNIHLGYYLIHQFKEFKRKISPISMEVLRDMPPGLTGVIDADHDGEDEVFYANVWLAPKKQQLSVFEPFEKNYNMDYYGETLAPDNYAFFDVYYENNLKTYIFRFLELKGGDFFIRDISNRQNLLKTVPLQRPKIKPAGEFSFTRPFLEDLESDGKNELIVILKSADYTPPRGVICFDPQSGKLQWQYYTGTGIESAEFKDIDSDGTKEIILTTFACNQNIDVNGTSDAHSYVIILDCNGNLRWKKEIERAYTYAYSTAADIDDDGIFEIVSSIGCHPSIDQKGGKLIVFDVKEGLQIKQSLSQPFSYSKPLVLKNKKNKTTIYIADSSGGIWMFDKNLNPFRKIKIGAPINILDTSSSREWEFVFILSQEKLLAFDKDLEREIFRFEFQGPVTNNANPRESVLLPLRTDHGNYAIVKYDKLYMLSAAKELYPGETFHHLVKTGLLLTFIALLLFNVFWIYFINRVRIFADAHIREKTAVETGQFLEIVQGIAHQIKNPLSTILWTAEKIKRCSDANKENKPIETDVDTGDYVQLSEFLMEDVNTLKRQTNNILKLIQIYKPHFKDVNLNPILRHIADHYRSLVHEKIDIRLEMEEDISLSIDEELFKEALVNVMDNAIDAMPEGGQLRISVAPVTSPVKRCVDYILIEVEDTGQGLNEEELSKIYTPFFTKKEKGTGIGLIICKRIVEAHGGKIKIHSRKNFGTKIAFSIPVTGGGKK